MSDTSVHALPGAAAGADIPPQPLPDPDSTGFWAATERGELALCRCQDCGTWLHPPLERCRRCGGPTGFETISGTGRVHSFIVGHRASVPGQGPGPHVTVLVELDGVAGVRLTGLLVDVDPGDVRIDDPVRARIVDVPGGGFRAPQFVRLAPTPDHAR